MIKKTIKQCCPNYYYYFKYLFLEHKKKYRKLFDNIIKPDPKKYI